MTLQQLRYLVEVVKKGSIRRAAESLYVTQPSISKAIGELEAELGVRILERNNRGVALTPEGENLFNDARMIVEQAASLEDRFKKQGGAQAARLSVSSQHYSFTAQALAWMMRENADRKYAFTLREGKTTDVMDDVHTGKSMLGVLSKTDFNRPFFERYCAARSLEFLPFASLAQHVFLRRDHPLSGQDALSIAQLRPYPCFSYQLDDLPLSFVEDALIVENAKQVVYLRDRGTMNELLANTDGYSLGTGCVVEGYMHPNICAVALRERNMIQLGALKRQDVAVSDDVSRFLELLREAVVEAVGRG